MLKARIYNKESQRSNHESDVASPDSKLHGGFTGRNQDGFRKMFPQLYGNETWNPLGRHGRSNPQETPSSLDCGHR